MYRLHNFSYPNHMPYFPYPDRGSMEYIINKSMHLEQKNVRLMDRTARLETFLETQMKMSMIQDMLRRRV